MMGVLRCFWVYILITFCPISVADSGKVLFFIKNIYGETITCTPFKFLPIAGSSGTWVLDEQSKTLVPPHGRPVFINLVVTASDLASMPQGFRRVLHLEFAGGKRKPLVIVLKITGLTEKSNLLGQRSFQALWPRIYGCIRPETEDTRCLYALELKELIYGEEFELTKGIKQGHVLFEEDDLLIQSKIKSIPFAYPNIIFTFQKK